MQAQTKMMPPVLKTGGLAILIVRISDADNAVKRDQIVCPEQDDLLLPVWSGDRHAQRIGETAALIDWDVLAQEMGRAISVRTGRPASLTRLVADVVFAVLCGCGHNIRMILGHLREALCRLIWLLTGLRKINHAAMAASGPFQILRTPA